MSEKKWFKSAFSEEISSSAPPSKKLRSLSRNLSFSNSLPVKQETPVYDLTQSDDDENVHPTTVLKNKKSPKIDFSSSNWIENFAPSSLPELAIHPKKVQEIKDWLSHCEAIKRKCPNAPILLVTGPAGSGKTAAIKVIAKEMKYQVVEWVTPIDVELVTYSSNGGKSEDTAFLESQVDVFRRFLFRSSRYKSVFDSLDKRLVIVEDFPNCFIKNSEGFNDILEDYRKYGKSPLIFIVTDSRSRSLNITYNLFPDNVQKTLSINHISFNPVSTTLMKKALNRICNLMSQEGFNQFYKSPNSDDVESINLASQGDIRNAIINLHFASQKGASRLQTEFCATSTSSKNKGKTKKLKTIGRDESITMMHALGRVFNPKYLDDKKKPQKLLHKPEVITDAFISQPKNFVDFIYSNYLPHFAEIGHVLEAIDSISRSDIMLSEYRENDLASIGLNIAVRGVMAYNEKPVPGWMPVRGIKKQNRDLNIQEELKSLGINWQLSRAVLASDYRTYSKIIRTQN